MKRTIVITAITLPCLLVLCGLSFAGVTGSKHDLSNPEAGRDDVCGSCHVPHRPEPPTSKPAWDPNADLTRTFGNPIQKRLAPGRGTTLCLTCHDGTVAPDLINGITPGGFTNKSTPAMFTAGGQTGNHPMGIKYPQVDKGFRAASSVIAAGTVTLPGGNVECISCHDPHDTSGVAYMLAMSNARSALCLTCHKK